MVRRARWKMQQMGEGRESEIKSQHRRAQIDRQTDRLDLVARKPHFYILSHNRKILVVAWQLSAWCYTFEFQVEILP